MALDITILGIDGSGKTTLAESAARILSRDYSVVTLGREAHLWKHGLSTRIFAEEDESIKSMSDINPVRRAYRRIAKTFWWPRRLRLTSTIHAPDIIIQDRDQIIDPVVLASSYIPGSMRIPMLVRMNVMKTVTRGKLPDIALYLEITPGTAYSRLCSRSDSNAEGLSTHENISSLELMAHQYAESAEHLKSLGVEVETISTQANSIKQTLVIFQGIIRPYLPQTWRMGQA